jgi:hypothetical protein
MPASQLLAIKKAAGDGSRAGMEFSGRAHLRIKQTRALLC